jgi:hypothetical protein
MLKSAQMKLTHLVAAIPFQDVVISLQIEKRLDRIP